MQILHATSPEAQRLAHCHLLLVTNKPPNHLPTDKSCTYHKEHTIAFLALIAYSSVYITSTKPFATLASVIFWRWRCMLTSF